LGASVAGGVELNEDEEEEEAAGSAFFVSSSFGSEPAFGGGAAAPGGDKSEGTSMDERSSPSSASNAITCPTGTFWAPACTFPHQLRSSTQRKSGR
jgi:hypothetical protein